ncbi:M20/M25/M40 family metallo-hydrolase [bacterium]|nr:M20/M25/M40 family metallo-hydrolase [candidate division CSSED10-310 bacterium]
MDDIRNNIKTYLQIHAESQVSFLIDLCNQNSHSLNKKGTDRVACMLLENLNGIFRIHETVTGKDTGDHHILRTMDHPGSVFLIGHMDTVFPVDHNFQKCRMDGEWLHGPGTGDMKGGLAVIVYALKALHHAGLTGDMNLTLILGADEEIGSPVSRAVYEREKQLAGICIGAECAGPAGEIVVSRNGKAGARLDCEGRDRHVGTGKHEKSSAILELAHKIIALESLNDVFPGVSVNIGRMEGGLGPSTVSAHACAWLDVRWRDEKHYRELKAKIREMASEPVQEGCGSTVTWLNHRPAMPPSENNRRLFESFRGISESQGENLKTEHRRGTSDVNFFGSSGVPSVDGLGPVCFDDHTPMERIRISSLLSRTALLALFLSIHRFGE